MSNNIFQYYRDIKSQHQFNRYCKFIQHYIDNPQVPIKGKGTRHHILLESMFPEFKGNRSATKCSWNRVWLTHKQHYIAHHILWKAIKNPQAQRAFYLMNHDKKTKRKITLSEWVILREEYSKNMSITLKGNQYRKGKKDSEETRELKRKTNGRFKRTTEWKEKLSTRMKIYANSDEHIFHKNNPMNDVEKRKLVSESKLGRKRIYREDGTFYMSERKS